jgi:hypothetical protein
MGESFSFDWRSLGAEWVTERDMAVSPPDAALERAARVLRDRGASVSPNITAAGGRVGFAAGWRSGRSWLACVSDAEVTAQAAAGRTTVAVRASVLPLVVWSALGAGAVLAAALAEWQMVALLLGAVLGGNGLAVYVGMRRLGRAAAGPADARHVSAA